MKRHLMRAVILVLILAGGLGYLVYTGFEVFVPPLASQEGTRIDQLLRFQFFLIAAIFSLVVGLAVYAVLVFRRRGDEEEAGEYIHGNPTLEITWTVIPLLIVLGLSAVTTRDFFWMRRPDYDMVVKVTGQQCAWIFEYPDYGIKSAELVVPTGKRIKFELQSVDVIHSFWVPEWRVKEDLVPGLTTYVYITPTQEGEFKLRCAELCGVGHATMRAPVRVVSSEAFEAWVAEQMPPADPVALGEKLVSQYCASCHSLDGSQRVGPTFLGIFGREVTFTDGTTATVDEDYIRESIREPQAKVVEGFQPIMPPFGPDRLSDEEVDAIIAFLKTLEK